MRPASVMRAQQKIIGNRSSSNTRIPLHARRVAPGLQQHAFPPPTTSASQLDTTAATTATNKSYRSSRPRIWATGFAVIIISGTILGAQLKSRKQAQDKLAVQKSTTTTLHHTLRSEDEDNGDGRGRELGSSNKNDESISNSRSDVNSSSLSPPPTPAPPSKQIDTEKQIAFLEERRATLMSQKLGLEQKLAEVRRKQQLAQEMESRKRQEVEPNR